MEKLEFRKIKKEDAKRIRQYNSLSHNSCENTVVNLLVWQSTYDNQICISNDIFYIRSGSDMGVSYRLPIGASLKEGVERLRENIGKEPKFWAPESEEFEEFSRLFADSYVIEEDRDAFDYLYEREALANLSGKKYHSKRNHISSFTKKYNWRYEGINNDNVSAVKECIERWYIENTERIDKYMSAEKKGIYTMLDNMEELEIKGGAIFVGENVVAFALGSEINADTFCVHIEKALSEYAQAYTVINREFVRNELEGYRFINREDDMGLEGLRRSKLSYHPYKLIKKYLCTPKKEYEERLECLEIYKEAFGDDGEFSKNLFENFFEYCKFDKTDGKISSMFFLLPCELVMNGKSFEAKYLFAAATKKEFRGRGFMSALIEKTLGQTEDFVFLKPSDDSLIEFYSRCGFETVTAVRRSVGDTYIRPADNFCSLAGDSEEDDGEYILMYRKNSKLNPKRIAFNLTME